jgi:hypothetical protein
MRGFKTQVHTATNYNMADIGRNLTATTMNVSLLRQQIDRATS